MKKNWFRTKLYGYGWVPATWQGWVCIGTYLLVVFASLASNTVYFHKFEDNLGPAIAEILFYTLLLLLVCYYTGEKPHWQWGRKNNESNS